MAEMPTSIEQNEQSEILNGDGANSTSSMSSPAETPTNIAKEQYEIPSIAINQDKIYRSYHQLVNSNRKMLKLQLLKDKNGQKQNFFKIVVGIFENSSLRI
jgi:hypothetical protein